MSVFVRGADERDHKVARQLLTASTVRVPCSTMTNVELEIAEEMKQRYDQIAVTLNAARAKSGQKPITGNIVMQVVLARFAGLPVENDVDLSSVSSPAQGGTQADWMLSTKPNPGASPDPNTTPSQADLMLSTKPHPGASADPNTTPSQADFMMPTRPHPGASADPNTTPSQADLMASKHPHTG